MFNSIEYINEPRWQKVSLGLDRITRLLELLGNPHERLKFVHVAGTNGKGSVCAYLESILRAAGYKTGLFTSPYIERFEERIRVNNENIDDESLTAITLRVKDAAEIVEQETGEHPTEFELMTAVAFSYFEQRKCDIVVCEVGLGGRLDSTNVITPEVSVITKIGLDHTAMLGNILAEIAGEKAGIIKPGTPVVVANQSSETLEVIKKVAEKNGCKLAITDADALQVDEEISAGDGNLARAFAYKNRVYMTQLLGDYQPQNAAVAIEVAAALDIADEQIFEGIYFTKWIGRFEVFTVNLPCPVIIDGAHNPDGAAALNHSLQSFSRSLLQIQRCQSSNTKLSSQVPQAGESLPKKHELESEKSTREAGTSVADTDKNAHIIAVFGVLKDKDVQGILQNVGSAIDEFVIYEPDNPRKMEVQELKKLTELYAQTQVSTDATSALKLAIEIAQSSGEKSQNLIVCFGSLYSIGDLRKHLLGIAK